MQDVEKEPQQKLEEAFQKALDKQAEQLFDPDKSKGSFMKLPEEDLDQEEWL